MSNSHHVYESPLASRNASPAMLALFSPQRKFSIWRRLWHAVAQTQMELGLSQITPAMVAELAAHLDDIDFDRAAYHEKRLRHDVMAHIHTLGELCPSARPIIHLGLTSMDIVDNADVILMREGLNELATLLANVVDRLGAFAETWKNEATLGYTHFQPAQLTTVGKRATLWAQDFALDLEEIERLRAGLTFRGIKGATGTQASLLELFEGNHAQVTALDKLVAKKMGFDSIAIVTGQTYTRKVDVQIACGLAGVAVSVHKLANDLRLLCHLRQIEEPFETEQVGSSAMAYKRNPMRMERATGLARFALSLVSSPLQTAAEQWLERTLDDSSNKRLSIPELFLSVDGCLNLVLNVVRGLVVNRDVIRAAVQAELPFMATEAILMAAVRAGGDRQNLHEVIRQASFAAAEEVKKGRPNDLLTRLSRDPALVPLLTAGKLNLAELTDPARFVGRSPEQVEEFLTAVVAPIRQRYRDQLGRNSELKV